MEKGSFPERLQRLRERKGISRRVLSELCGLPTGAVRRYERGEVSPTLPALIALAAFFGVSLDELAGESEEKSRPQTNPSAACRADPIFRAPRDTGR